MKYLLTLFIPVLYFGLVSFISIEETSEYDIHTYFNIGVDDVEVSEDVKAVLDRSCLPCHGADGSGKAKMKWNWEKMSEYSKTKMISKLSKLAEEVEEEKMPPPKHLKKNPDKNLSDEEKQLLMNWADEAASKLVNSNE